MPHAVARLRAAALAHSASTLPRLDRGEPRKLRCARCRLIPSHCLCALRPSASARSAICLVMAEFEALKPSNTGWLIADVLADTTAFAWHRNAPDPDLQQMLADPQWQPVVVFPGEFAEDASRVVHHWPPAASADDDTRRPLFILLDGTWSEARKIFRKSPYLATLPVLSLQTEQLSRYRLRRSIHGHHFCTSEVAALCLAQAGDHHAAQVLEAYLDVFSTRYLQARQSVAADEGDGVHGRLRGLVGQAGV